MVRFIRDGWVHDGAHLVSLNSFGRVQGVVGFIRSRAGYVVCIRFSCVHSGVSWGWSGSFAFVGYILERPGVRRVHSGSMG